MHKANPSTALALESLLAEPLGKLHQREQDVAQQGKFDVTNRPVLFGCGTLGRTALAGLRRDGVEPLAYADNNPFVWGTTVDGLPVMSLADAVNRFGQQTPFVVTIYTASTVEAQLRSLGLNILSFPQLALRHSNSLLPWGALDLPSTLCAQAARIRGAFALWADEYSQQEYVAQVRFRYTLDCDVPPHLPADLTYFPLDLVALKSDEVFVDCGAFDGDSIMAFLRRSGGWFREVVAIEADPLNADRLRQSTSRLPKDVASKVGIIQAAVSAKDGAVRFAVTGTAASHTGSVAGQGTVDVPCRTLDHLLAGRNPSYIKMDIEGAEPSALEGCRQVIQQHAPVLAICLYHRQSDLWEIPLQIRQMTDQYSFFLRRYSDDCWEQVLYAIPRERL